MTLMTWKMALFTYVNLWWISLFFAWPFSIEAADPSQASDNSYASAPKKIHWKKMLVLTSALGAILTCLVAIIITYIKQGS